MSISQLYDLLWKIGDELIQHYQPCDWLHSKCREDRRYGTKGACCHTCRYLTSKGCSTKSLGCKVYLCGTVQRTYPDLAASCRTIQLLAHRAGIPLAVRKSKRAVLSTIKKRRLS